MARENHVEALLRWRKLELLQETYPHFVPFLQDMMLELRFHTSWIQEDIAEFLEYGPLYLMVQAQRGQAKSTITAIYAVWHLIHNPEGRVLIISAGEKQANEISTLITRFIGNVDILECMRPDASSGDRTSVEAYDIHHSLKGLDKSPSVACVGINGNLQGKRATLLIADDVESKKNSKTATSRADLLDLTRDFTSICEVGRIIYLGTPQSQDSIYNTLPSRGFAVRVWPGRYPTKAQMGWYDDRLSPALLARLKAHPELAFGGGVLADQGQPTDDRLNEEVLQKKERDQGPAYFQLQHMLSTTMTDALRYPLKPENLIVMRLGGDRFPMSLTRSVTLNALQKFEVHGHAFSMATPVEVSETFQVLDSRVMYVDPAGGGTNGDESGYAVAGGLNGNVFLLDAGGVPGGYSREAMLALAEKAIQWQVNVVVIEKNFGYGSFREVWLPILRAAGYKGGVEDDYVTGQKELRIIETLEPVMSRGSLIVNEDLVEWDKTTSGRYHAAKRLTYSLFFQMSRITRDPKCLIHDDRLDAVEGAVRHYLKSLQIDQAAEEERRKQEEWKRWIADPLQRKRYSASPTRGPSMMDRYRR